MNTQEQVKCGMCNSYHESLADLKAYHKIGAPPVSTAPPSMPVPTPQSGAVAQSGLLGRVGQPGYITLPQFNHLKNDLGADENVVCWYTKKGASGCIERMRAERDRNKVMNGASQTTKIPLAMLTGLRDGYYAARQSAEEDWMFFRVSHPKKNKYAGATKIQTQHGPNLKTALIVWPSGQISFYQRYTEENLLLVAVDPKGCGRAYAEEIGRCMRCGLELTDARSRWYGIGPDCEQVWTDVVPAVEDIKGRFVHGS